MVEERFVYFLLDGLVGSCLLKPSICVEYASGLHLLHGTKDQCYNTPIATQTLWCYCSYVYKLLCVPS